MSGAIPLLPLKCFHDVDRDKFILFMPYTSLLECDVLSVNVCASDALTTASDAHTNSTAYTMKNTT
jgi:hypothetical protein